MIPLKRALRRGKAPQVSFVGAGGKTAALFILARLFDSPVLVTTSTHLAVSQAEQGDQHLAILQAKDLASLEANRLPPVTVITGGSNAEGRLGSLDDESLHKLSAFARQYSCPVSNAAD